LERIPANRRWPLNARLAMGKQPYGAEGLSDDVDTLMEYRAYLLAELQSVERTLRGLGGFTVAERVE
jgi:hypothetical protein